MLAALPGRVTFILNYYKLYSLNYIFIPIIYNTVKFQNPFYSYCVRVINIHSSIRTHPHKLLKFIILINNIFLPYEIYLLATLRCDKYLHVYNMII